MKDRQSNRYRLDLILSDPSIDSTTTDGLGNSPTQVPIFAQDGLIIGAVVKIAALMVRGAHRDASFGRGILGEKWTVF